MGHRGGMCRSPFGHRFESGIAVSNRRLDKIDVAALVLRGNTPWQYGVFSELLIKSVHNYWYWGLGNNGCTDVKFLDAFDYLFKIRSTDPSTWGDRVQTFTEELADGSRVRHSITLDDEDMRLRCFDIHYKLLNLDQFFPMSVFLRKLEKTRQDILSDNREQVEIYLESQRAREFQSMPAGSQMRFSFTVHDFIQTLSRPDSIRQIEELVMFPVPDVRPCRTKLRRVNHSRPARRSNSEPSPNGTLYGRSLLEKADVGHTHNNPGRACRGLSPIQAP